MLKNGFIWRFSFNSDNFEMPVSHKSSVNNPIVDRDRQIRIMTNTPKVDKISKKDHKDIPGHYFLKMIFNLIFNIFAFLLFFM